VLGGITHYLELYLQWKPRGCLGWSWRFSPCHVMLLDPFLQRTHLNFSVSSIKRLYLCSTLVFGGNTHYLELYWMLETLCLNRSWRFSPCHVLLLGPSIQGPTWISLLWLYIGYICVPHWGWVLAPITCNFWLWKPYLGCSWCFSPCHFVLHDPFPPGRHLNFSV
jgi:hypothetical protein